MTYNQPFCRRDYLERRTHNDLISVMGDIDKPINYNIYCIHKDEYWKFNLIIK